MEIKAKLNYLRMSPRKVRAVADVVRGKKAETALLELGFVAKRAVSPIEKLIKSALASAEAKNLDKNSLFIKNIQVNGGPIMKRFMPRAFGRTTTIRKRTSHINIILTTHDELKIKNKSKK